MLHKVSEPKRRVKKVKRNWLDLPSDVMANILFRVGVIDILENAQKVCTTWRKICKKPTMWTVIYMNNISADTYERDTLREMCKHAVDRSQGQLSDITVMDFADDMLLMYIVNRSCQLRRLEIACCHSNIKWSWPNALKKLKFLEELVIYSTAFPKKAIETVARCCPKLRTLKLNEEAGRFWDRSSSGKYKTVNNERAIAIGENLPKLRHLELIGNNMSNNGLQVILDGCRHLISLDLRQCFYINLEGDFGIKCSKEVKYLKLPKDSLEGCPYITDRYIDSLYDFNTVLEDRYIDDTTDFFESYADDIRNRAEEDTTDFFENYADYIRNRAEEDTTDFFENYADDIRNRAEEDTTDFLKVMLMISETEPMKMPQTSFNVMLMIPKTSTMVMLM